MEKGEKYKLISFNGTTVPGEECSFSENYWVLIGQQGTLVNFSQELGFGNKDRVLIQFDLNVLEQGLECHNSIPNTLWILKSDLEKNK